ncbi:MAG: hypothetical protein IJK28_08360 [Clostridia bacterium]|nr:hypothetical protein [Clostridia bacterium]
MKNRKRICKVSAMLLILALLLGTVSTGVNENGSGAVYSDWLHLDELLGSEEVAEPSGTRDLRTLLRDAVLLDADGTVLSEDGVWPVTPDASLRVRLGFREMPGDESLQFDAENPPLVFPLPKGMSAGDENLTLPLRISADSGESAEAVCLYDAAENTLIVSWDPESGAAELILASESASFDVVIPAVFSDADTLVFADHLTVSLVRTESAPLTAQGPDYLIRVWPMAGTKLPEGAVLSAAELTDHAAYEGPVLERVGIDAEDLTSMRVFDLAILSDGAKVEPEGPVRVEIRMQVEGERVAVVHFPDAPVTRVRQTKSVSPKSAPLPAAESLPVSVADGVISFETGSFSAYAVVGYRLERLVIASDGIAYLISVTYTEDAGIPEGAQLVTNELPESDPRYRTFLDESAQAMGCAPEELTHSRLFDITIVSPEGAVVEPAAPVQVRIEYADPLQFEEAQRFLVVHLSENGTECMVPATEGAAEGQVDAFTFVASFFSFYGIVSTEVPQNLDGQTFALVNANSKIAMLSGSQNNNTRLSAISVTEKSGYLQAGGDLELWTFHDAGNGQYSIEASNGRFLNLGNNALTTSSTPQALNVVSAANGTVRITNDGGRGVSLTTTGSAGDGFSSAASQNNNNQRFTLYSLEQLNGPFEGQKISVQAMEDADRVIIYRSVYNPLHDTYEDFVIDGTGQPVRAYDKGDRLTLYSAVSPVWTVIFHRDATTGELNGYYDFYNEETGMYLSPRGNGTLVSSDIPGVTLNGRRDGAYNSTIESWDTSFWAWYGYQYGEDDEQNITLASGTGADSQPLSFARYVTEVTSGLHPVPTVDSVSAGITMKLYDFNSRDTITNVVGGNTYQGGNHYNNSGLASKTLVNGYPYFSGTGKSASQLFSGGNYKGDANQLFLSSVYYSTGYYEYNCFNNYAYYNQQTGNFTVYKETGTPSNDNQFYYKRGNFYPYNQLDSSRAATNYNQYNGSGSELDFIDPTRDGTLYLTSGKNDYFGMTMEFNFMQPKNGYNNGSPMVYEFNGDDDLWIYIDGVLVLDIGGVHDALPGTINFATGEIHYLYNDMDTTIKACFKTAGVFPDGTPWDDSRVDEYFKGDTFVDYGSHTFNMFYMEHGAGASNLEMRFNLPVIERGRFAVEKELEGTDQERFANVNFAYQAFIRKDDGTDEPLTKAWYEGTDDPLEFYKNVHIGNQVYQNVFYLKPGEAAIFEELPEETNYWVRELGIGSAYYDEVHVNDVTIDGQNVTPVDGVYPTTVATVAGRARVIYGNKCAETNLNELQITKRLAAGSTTDGSTFEFRVLLENAEGSLVPYSTGPYMIRNDNSEYFHYVNGKLTSNGLTPIQASVAGNNGTIAGIPADYTVIISNLLVGTDFYVEEIRNPDGWIFVEKTVEDCDDSDLQAPGMGFAFDDVTADGQIALGEDAKIVIVNRETDPVTDRVSGKKVMKGRDMKSGEFIFTMAPIDLSGTVIGEEITARNQAGADEEVTSFAFPDLSFSIHDYKNAEYRDSDGSALFYYVVSELASENADSQGYDPEKYLYYDRSQYLVVFRLSFDKDSQSLSVTHTIYPYSGNGVPVTLQPGTTGNQFTADAGLRTVSGW